MKRFNIAAPDYIKLTRAQIHSFIRPVAVEDAEAICQIYNHYVLHTPITFEEKAVSPAEMAHRIEQVAASFPWLVCMNNREILGYAYATQWKARSAYRHSVESTIYLRHDLINQGVGTLLYHALLTQLQDQSIHTVIGGIALPNPASVALHQKLGFTKVAHLKQCGWKFEQWIDVGYWQLLL